MATEQELLAAMNIDQRLAYIRFIYHRAPTPAETAAVIKEWAAAHFGALAAYLDVPEVGAIINQAALGGWTPERLQVALGQTNWWRTTTASQRQFDALKATDPAEANKQISGLAANLTSLAAREGITLTADQITQMATTLARNGTAAENDLTRAVVAQAAYNPTQPAGIISARVTQVKQAAYNYGLPVDDQGAFNLAKQIETGDATAEGVMSLFKNQAKAAYGTDPNLVAQIDAGFTVRDILAPQISTAAQLLGVDPNTIDFRDSKWSPLLSYADGNTTRVRNADETARYVRSLDDYWQTNQAEAEAAQFVTGLAQQFGKA